MIKGQGRPASHWTAPKPRYTSRGSEGQFIPSPSPMNKMHRVRPICRGFFDGGDGSRSASPWDPTTMQGQSERRRPGRRGEINPRKQSPRAARSREPLALSGGSAPGSWSTSLTGIGNGLSAIWPGTVHPMPVTKGLTRELRNSKGSEQRGGMRANRRPSAADEARKAYQRGLLMYCWKLCQWRGIEVRGLSASDMVFELTGNRLSRHYAYMWIDQERKRKPHLPDVKIHAAMPDELRITPKPPPPVPSKEFYESDAWRELRWLAIRTYGNSCQACGRNRKEHGVVIHVDHVQPRSKRPDLALSLSNLQILCEDCNLGKSNRDSTDWR